MRITDGVIENGEDKEKMKIVTLKFKIIIGIVLFIVLVGAAYYEKYVNDLSTAKLIYIFVKKK